MYNYCVYELIFPNGKRYIGLTGQKPESRWKNGRGYKDQLVYKPIKKYGWKNIKHIVISGGLTQEQAVRLEKYLIGYYKSNNPLFGYNCTEGGSNFSILSDEIKQKIKDSWTPDRRKQQSCKWRNRWNNTRKIHCRKHLRKRHSFNKKILWNSG